MNLRLLQLADSALPISGYTQSWGLEAAIAERRVDDPPSLEHWTRQWLELAVGPLEGVLVGAACRATQAGDRGQLAQLNEWAEASMVVPSTRRASREMGDQLLLLGATWLWSAEATRRFALDEPHGWHHAVAFGFLGAAAAAEPEEVLTAYLHQAALGMITAGVRAIPVGHTHGQQVLAYVQAAIEALVPQLLDRAPETAGAGCPFYEVLCDAQTQLYARMFRS